MYKSVKVGVQISLFILTSLVFTESCNSDIEKPEGIIGLNQLMGEDVADYVTPDQLLAYITEDDNSIYVAKGFEKSVAQEIGALVEGNIWILKEDSVKREQKELKWEDWYPRVAIIKWTYMKNFKCIEKPAGTWINITDKRNRFLRSYKTTQKDWWCMRTPGSSCKIVLKTITDDFYTKPNGRGKKKRETRKLSACSP